MRNRQERRQVELKITKVSDTESTAERGIGSKSPESSSSYFLVIKDLFQTRRRSQASNTPLRDICRQVGRSWPGKGTLRQMKLIYLHKRVGGQGNLDEECYLPSKTFESNQCTAPLSTALLNNGGLAPDFFHQEERWRRGWSFLIWWLTSMLSGGSPKLRCPEILRFHWLQGSKEDTWDVLSISQCCPLLYVLLLWPDEATIFSHFDHSDSSLDGPLAASLTLNSHLLISSCWHKSDVLLKLN